jgi:hypothetical protein
LLRTTLQQAGVVRDAIASGARQGRSKLDNIRADRRRHDALAELGELVLDLIRRGEIDLGELPEARDLIRHLDELDAEGGDFEEDIATPPARRRFDERATPPTRAPARRDASDDGTVTSSTRWAPPSKAAAPARVWRPPTPEPAERETEPEPGRKPIPIAPNPHRKGGISFEDDDLADYMHPDDVPPKDPTDGDS